MNFMRERKKRSFKKYKGIAKILCLKRDEHYKNIEKLQASVLNGSATDDDLRLERKKYYNICAKLNILYWKTDIVAYTELKRLGMI